VRAAEPEKRKQRMKMRGSNIERKVQRTTLWLIERCFKLERNGTGGKSKVWAKGKGKALFRKEKVGASQRASLFE
jgi:hypothetical protein